MKTKALLDVIKQGIRYFKFLFNLNNYLFLPFLEAKQLLLNEDFSAMNLK